MTKSFNRAGNSIKGIYILAYEFATHARKKTHGAHHKKIITIFTLALCMPLGWTDVPATPGFKTPPKNTSPTDLKEKEVKQLVEQEKEEEETKLKTESIEDPLPPYKDPVEIAQAVEQRLPPFIKGEKIIYRTDVFESGLLDMKDKDSLKFQGAQGDFKNEVSGNGIIEIDPTSRVNFTSQSDAFSGTTAVSGRLSVNGGLGGNLDIFTNGRLEGHGRVGNTLVRRGATIAPGNSIGTLTVNGNLTLAEGSIFEAEIDPDGRSDRIEATGEILIEKAHLRIWGAKGTYKDGTTRYHLLQAQNGISGKFADISSNLPFVDLTLDYQNKNHLYLNLTRNQTPFKAVTQKDNQKAVAGAVESSGAGSALYHLISTARTPEEANYTYDALSGELYAASQSFFLEDSYHLKNAATSHLRTRTGKDKSEEVESWIQGDRTWGAYHSNNNADLNYRQTRFLAGIGNVINNWRVGVLGGYGRSKLNLESPYGASTVDSYHLGVYAGTLLDKWNILLGSSYTWNKIRAGRDFMLGNQQFSHTADYPADTLQFFGEVGYAFAIGQTLSLEPVFGLSHTRLDSKGFQESGDSVSALASEGTKRDVTFSTVGLRVKKDYALNQKEGELEAGLAWRHAYGDIHPVSHFTLSSGNSIDNIKGVAITKDAAVMTLSGKWKIGKQTLLALNYAGLAAKGNWRNSIRANLIWNF